MAARKEGFLIWTRQKGGTTIEKGRERLDERNEKI